MFAKLSKLQSSEKLEKQSLRSAIRHLQASDAFAV